MKKRKTKFLCAVLLLGLLSLSACGKDSKLLSGKHYAEIHIKNMGVISLELDADSAPITVTNFVKVSTLV